MNLLVIGNYDSFTYNLVHSLQKHFGQYDHVRLYGMDYYKRLVRIGFRVEQVMLSNELTLTEITKMGLEKGEILPVVFKPNS